MGDYMNTLTAKEADALYDAATYMIKLQATENIDALKSATRKLRYSTMLIIQPSKE